jgi:hypothetical protein
VTRDVCLTSKTVKPMGFYLSLESSPDRRMAAERGFLHHDESRSLQLLGQPLGADLGHDLVGVVDALAALEAQREGERIGEVLRVGRCQLVLGHG